MKGIYDKYPTLYPPDKYTIKDQFTLIKLARYGKNDYLWAYESVMTRCFGWHLPSTMIVPFADFMNHWTEGVSTNIINVNFEKEEKTTKGTYYLKKRRMDISLSRVPGLELDLKEREKHRASTNSRLKCIQKNLVRSFILKETA